jgi:hypothetical protein
VENVAGFRWDDNAITAFTKPKDNDSRHGTPTKLLPQYAHYYQDHPEIQGDLDDRPYPSPPCCGATALWARQNTPFECAPLKLIILLAGRST